MSRILRRIRVMGWGTLLLCFFLPFARGCSSTPYVPYELSWSSVGWRDALWRFSVFGLPFLYPVVLLAGYCLRRSIRDENVRRKLTRLTYTTMFFPLTGGTVSLIVLLYRADGVSEQVTYSISSLWFVVLWGIMAFGFSRLQISQWLSMVAFQFSAASLWMIAWMFAEADRLIGAWLSLSSSAIVVGTYVIDFFKGQRVNRRTGQRT